MNEPKTIERARKEAGGRIAMTTPVQSEPIEASQIRDENADLYESESGVPYIIGLLGLDDDYRIDVDIQSKGREINRFIKEELMNTGRRDTLVSYKEMIDGILGKRGIYSYEMEVRAGRGLKLLNVVFQNIAIIHGLSGDTYSKKVKQIQDREKVASLTNQLREAIKNIQ